MNFYMKIVSIYVLQVSYSTDTIFFSGIPVSEESSLSKQVFGSTIRRAQIYWNSGLWCLPLLEVSAIFGK